MLRMLRRASPRAKSALRNVGRQIGFDIRLNGINSRDDLRFVHFLKMHNIDTVLDVGANRGQFATQLFKAGYEGHVISFEPLPNAHAELSKVAAAYGERWVVAPCVALSDKAGAAKFFVTEVDTASSLLEPLDSLVEATPQARIEQCIEVQTERLDVLAGKLDLDLDHVFLKLDVQGSETQVLAGASDMLTQFRGVLVELSLVELYSGQSSDVIVQQVITGAGFEVWDIWRGYHDPSTQRLKQIDVLYFVS